MAFKEQSNIHAIDSHRASSPLPTSSLLNFDFVRDIIERSSSTSTSPPAPPGLKIHKTGFPAHKRLVQGSTFRQQRDKHKLQDSQSTHELPFQAKTPNSNAVRVSLPDRDKVIPPKSEKQEIDIENRMRLAQMSPPQIEQERAELMAGLSSSLIERLLKKANIEDHRASEGMDSSNTDTPVGVKSDLNNPFSAPKPLPKTSIVDKASERRTGRMLHIPSSAIDPEAASVIPPSDLHPASSQLPTPSPFKLHFPQQGSVLYLDPSDPDFMAQLHSKYFPDLPVDPSKMAWMAPIPSEDSPADRDSPYNPSQKYLHPSSIRFDFTGRLIPPRLARQIPATKGLHHHGLAPEAAGYTVPELTHLSRSAVTAQRCIAYQTLGRILYRLGRGEFGGESDELYLGLWKCIEEGRIFDTLSLEAEAEDGQGNRTCKVTAEEAIWLWKKGGGKRQKAA